MPALFVAFLPEPGSVVDRDLAGFKHFNLATEGRDADLGVLEASLQMTGGGDTLNPTLSVEGVQGIDNCAADIAVREPEGAQCVTRKVLPAKTR